MTTDAFTVSLGIITAGLFFFEKENYVDKQNDGKNPITGVRLLAELALMMYALMNHDIVIAAGQAAILILTILLLIKNQLWLKISTAIKAISITLPMLIVLAIATTSTYQYRLLIPAVPLHIIIIGSSAYVIYTYKFLLDLIQRDHTRLNMQRHLLTVASCALLIAYSTYRTDLILLIINSIIGWRSLHALARSHRSLPAAGIMK